MREMGGILHSRECHQTSREMLPNVPGNVLKHSGGCRETFRRIFLNNLGNVSKNSGECCQKFRGILPMFGVNEENYWAESHLEACQTSIASRLNLFSLVSHLSTPWKRQKTFDFMTFSGGIEIWLWTKMGYHFNYFCKKAPPQMFDWIPNAPIYFWLYTYIQFL